MDTPTELELCKPLPFLLGENGAFGITDGTSHWTVIVTREAMEASAVPPDASLPRLVRHVELYRAMAEAAIARKEDEHGKVWIFEKDVLAYRLGYTRPVVSRFGKVTPGIRSH